MEHTFLYSEKSFAEYLHIRMKIIFGVQLKFIVLHEIVNDLKQLLKKIIYEF